MLNMTQGLAMSALSRDPYIQVHMYIYGTLYIDWTQMWTQYAIIRMQYG